MSLGEIDHLGYACNNIETTLNVLKKIYTVLEISPVYFDSYQNAKVCYLTVDKGYNIELVSGGAVEGIIAKGISLYHTCYKVDNLEQSIEYLRNSGAIIVKAPHPAILFNNRRVAFLETELGLIELLERESLLNPSSLEGKQVIRKNSSLVEKNLRPQLEILEKGEFKIEASAQNQIYIVGTFNTDLICNFLTDLKNYFNLPLHIEQAPYNQIMQILHDENSLFYHNHSIHRFIFLRLSDTLRFTATDASLEKYNKILQNYCNALLEGVSLVAQKDIHLNIYFFPENISENIELKNLLQTYYQYLSEKLSEYKNISLSHEFLKFNGRENFDLESEKIGHLPYTESCTQAISLKLIRTIHSYIRKPYKVIVVDCDNTLWEGICAESEASELKLTWANIKLQEMLVELKKKGMLICLASKNNENDVLNVFNNNSAMRLSLKDIACYQINWESKSKNIQKIATILNLSSDDFVFIDDNPIEIAEVSSALPNLLCLEFPLDEKNAKYFFENAWFADINQSSEFDAKRTLFYQSNVSRTQLRQSSTSFEEFLKKLELNITFKKISEDEFERVSQLTYRTNQFNFTAIKYKVAELINISQKQDASIYGISVSDRFGDYGLVGICLLESRLDKLLVTSFLLSCRVLGKGIEHELLRKIAIIAKENHKHILSLKFIQTNKNQPAYDFIQTLPINEIIQYVDHAEYQFLTDKMLDLKYKPSSIIEGRPSGELQPLPIINNISRQTDNIIIKKAIYEYPFNKNLELKCSRSQTRSLEEIEAFLAETWQHLLNKPINSTDNFLAIGGDSLLSLRIMSKIKKEFNIELSLDYIFQSHNLKDIALDIFNKLQVETNTTPNNTIQKASAHVLTYTQEWLWLLDQYDEEKSWYYNMPYAVRLQGELNIAAIEYALVQLVNRHCCLRMQIVEENYQYIPKIENKVGPFLEFLDLEGAPEKLIKEIFHQKFCKPFDLSKDLPIRAYVYKFHKNDHVLLIVNHHIVFDGWSYKILNVELAEFYRAYLEKRKAKLGQLPIDFFDYAYWYKQHIERILPAKLKYWEDRLMSLPKQNLPDRKTNKSRSHIGEYFPLKLEASLTQQISTLAIQKQTSSFSIILTLYALFIAHKCSSQDILILCPVSGRQYPNTEELIGCFVNIVPFRLRVDFNKSFSENFDNNHKHIISALNNQEVPFNILLKKINIQTKELDSGLFQIMFAWQNTKTGILELPGIESSLYQRGYDAARLEFILELEEYDAEIIGGIYYNTEVFSKESIISYSNEFIELSKSCINSDSTPIHHFLKSNISISYLATEINYSPINFNDMVDWFEKTVEKFPHRIAIKSGKNILKYEELNILSNQFAYYLEELGVKSGSIVAFSLPANHLSLITLIAIMKLGGTYLPIEQSSPENYVDTILQDAQVSFLIYSNVSLRNKDIPCLNLTENIFKELKKYPTYNLIGKSRNLAYIIYTSGTTGKPKGVKIKHENIMQLMASTQNEYQFNENDIILLFHSLAFDFSVWEFWSAFCYGGMLVVPNRCQVKSPEEIFDLIQTENITILNQTPTAFKQLALYQENIGNNPLSSLRLIIFGGEQLTPSDLKDFNKINRNIKYYNMYGITEVTVHASIKEISPSDMTQTSNIGIPLPGRCIYLLDEDGKLVNQTEVGEIHVGGLGVSDGYHHLDEKTKQVFVPDLFDSTKTMYKSGDLARITAGELEYLGRKDSQIQRHGFRIELSGIEATLNKHQGIKFSAVNLVDGNLCAFVIPDFNKCFHFVIEEYMPKDLAFLPNGMPVYQLNKNETDFLYEEIFSKQQYFPEGIELPDNACVIDVGANIGMFAIQTGQVSPNAIIYAIEPIPSVYKILEKNSQLYHLNIKNFNFGISDICQKQKFTYYPKMSIMSGLLANIEEEQVAIKAHLQAQLGENYSALNPIEMDEWLANYLDKEIIECSFITISQFIKDNSIETIDLLKIDVEKHEENVLLGIKDEDWGRIKQIIIEVQNDNAKKERVINLLEKQNFYLKEKQCDALTHSNIFTIYASKKPFVKETIKLSDSYRYQWYNQTDFLKSIKSHIKSMLPPYMHPQYYSVVEQFPIKSTGKIDFSEFHFSKEKFQPFVEPSINSANHEKNQMIQYIIDVWANLLGHHNIQNNDNFFEIGGNSLMIIQAYMAMKKELPATFRMIDFFNYSTPSKLAERILSDGRNNRSSEHLVTKIKKDVNDNDIAIIGYAGVFPGAKNIQAYWDNLIQAKDCITHFSDDDLKHYHGSEEYIKNPNFIKSCGKIDNIDLFDADFFGFTPKDACLLDPQYRIFLEVCWQALHLAGYSSEKTKETIGLYAGMGHPHYLDALYRFHHLRHEYGRELAIEIANHKDYLANRVAHKLNLTGAAVNINTACSTSLVACIKACQSLLACENDLVLAGGVSLILPENYGYFHQGESVLSKDGICRPFSKMANGTVISSGAGAVVLKRLPDALRDNDNIRAIIKGFAINNDGNQKIGFTAPSIVGQAKCISKAQAMASIKPQDISYIEAHGTGTRLGDPIEVEALMQVFNDKSISKKSCILGSVKGNIGHTDSASGMAGLLKLILMLENKKIPPTLHFGEANEQIEFEQTPFYINNELREWHSDRPLVGAISSFGIGGTNAHMILCEHTQKIETSSIDREHLIIISAKNETALNHIYEELTALISKNSAEVADIAFTLQTGRQDFKYRRAWLVHDWDALEQLTQFPNGNITEYSEIIQGETDTSNQWIISSKLWLSGETVDWSSLHQNCKHKTTSVPLHPLNRKSYWYNHINFAKSGNDITILGTLKNLISNLFSIPTIKNDDDFFNIGGDSLAALSLLEMIKQKFQVSLTLDDIYKARVIENIALKIGYATSRFPLQIEMLKSGDRNKTLILIHPLNGSIFCYENLVNGLNGWDIFGIRNETILDSKYDSIENLAKKYIEVIQSNNLKPPYILMGWSFGGNLAYEIAKQLILLDISIEHVFMIDSWCRFGGSFEDEKFVQKLFWQHHNDWEDSNQSDWVKEWELKLWQRVRILFNYKPKPCDINATLFKANILYPELEGINDETNHWGSILGQNLSIINLDADHQTIMNVEHSIAIAKRCQQIILNNPVLI